MTQDLKELFPYTRIKTINEIFQPYIEKWGVDDCRALIHDIETAGYSFVETKPFNEFREWAIKEIKWREKHLAQVDQVIEASKKVFDSTNKVTESTDRLGEILNGELTSNNVTRPWWKWW